MLKSMKMLMAASAFALFATPVAAQVEPEEPRTTYSVTLLKFAEGAEERVTEILTDIVTPAQIAAGQTPDVVHWVMGNPDYDLIIVTEMPNGMATFDTHTNPQDEAFMTELTRLAGGETAIEGLTAEWDALVDREMTYYTHTHP